MPDLGLHTPQLTGSTWRRKLTKEYFLLLPYKFYQLKEFYVFLMISSGSNDQSFIMEINVIIFVTDILSSEAQTLFNFFSKVTKFLVLKNY